MPRRRAAASPRSRTSAAVAGSPGFARTPLASPSSSTTVRCRDFAARWSWGHRSTAPGSVRGIGGAREQARRCRLPAGARIFTLSMAPELVSIAGVYRTSEVPWPDEVLGKPTQVRLFSGPEGDKLVMDAIKP